MIQPSISPAHTVQLLHELPDGSRHVDWMIDLDPGSERELLTFRLERRVDEMSPGERLTVERLADHRRAYLSYEGPISGDRGHVKRIASGQIGAMQSLGNHMAFLIGWQAANDVVVGGWQRVLVRRRTTGEWIVEVLRVPG
jgi:hypothetical protein